MADILLVDSNGYFHDLGGNCDNRLGEVGDTAMGVGSNAMHYMLCPSLDAGAVEMHLVPTP